MKVILYQVDGSYPMAYQTNPELLGFQRWVIKAYDKRLDWETFKRAKWQILNVKYDDPQDELFGQLGNAY